jgi:hypothetical protein
MNDDEFSGVVSSGKHHSVSVSESTGDAKTPHNFVTSDEEKTLSKVRAFEGKEGEFDPLSHNLAEEQNLRLDKYQTKPTQDLNTQKAPVNTAAVENLQTVKQGSIANDKQAAPRESETTANWQSVQTTAAKANLQSVSADTLKDNQQSIATDKSEDNRQGIATENLKESLQDIQTESINDNLQSITNDNLENNIQSISSPQVAPQKPQGIGKDPIRTNDADIAKENIQDRDARVEKEQVKTNTANISIDVIPNNKQVVQSASVSDNLASISKYTQHETRQALDKDNFQDRGATVVKTSVEGNVLAVPTEPSIGNNFQPVEKKPIADHLEALPSEVRPLGESASKASPSPLQSFATKTAVASATPLVNPQKIAPSRAISLAEATKMALAHQVKMAAFHSRLVDIKHNVDEIKHKLDDVENKS